MAWPPTRRSYLDVSRSIGEGPSPIVGGTSRSIGGVLLWQSVMRKEAASPDPSTIGPNPVSGGSNMEEGSLAMDANSGRIQRGGEVEAGRSRIP